MQSVSPQSITLLNDWPEVSPDKLAIQFGNQTLTFQEIADFSDFIKIFLINQNQNGNKAVGIMANRELITPAIIYGIWKAGCYYVPIDPNFPKSRVEYIIKKCGIGILFSFNVPNEFSAKIVSPKISKYFQSTLCVFHKNEEEKILNFFDMWKNFIVFLGFLESCLPKIDKIFSKCFTSYSKMIKKFQTPL